MNLQIRKSEAQELKQHSTINLNKAKVALNNYLKIKQQTSRTPEIFTEYKKQLRIYKKCTDSQNQRI